MAPSSSQKREIPILTVVGVVLVLVLVAAGYWLHYVIETKKALTTAFLSAPAAIPGNNGVGVAAQGQHEQNLVGFHEQQSKRDDSFQGAVVGLLLILVLISARGHIFRPMHM